MSRKPKILLVEDNPADVRLAQEALRLQGFEVQLEVAKDGVEALDFLYQRGNFASAAKPDIVLLDLNLPKKDGREVLAEVKKDEQLRTIPVVILTSSRSPTDIIATLKLYANSYVQKPVEILGLKKVFAAIQSYWFDIVSLTA